MGLPYALPETLLHGASTRGCPRRRRRSPRSPGRASLLGSVHHARRTSQGPSHGAAEGRERERERERERSLQRKKLWGEGQSKGWVILPTREEGKIFGSKILLYRSHFCPHLEKHPNSKIKIKKTHGVSYTWAFSHPWQLRHPSDVPSNLGNPHPILSYSRQVESINLLSDSCSGTCQCLAPRRAAARLHPPRAPARFPRFLRRLPFSCPRRRRRIRLRPRLPPTCSAAPARLAPHVVHVGFSSAHATFIFPIKFFPGIISKPCSYLGAPTKHDDSERTRCTQAREQNASKKSGHPESNQGPSDCCMCLQSDALPTEL